VPAGPYHGPPAFGPASWPGTKVPYRSVEIR